MLLIRASVCIALCASLSRICHVFSRCYPHIRAFVIGVACRGTCRVYMLRTSVCVTICFSSFFTLRNQESRVKLIGTPCHWFCLRPGDYRVLEDRAVSLLGTVSCLRPLHGQEGAEGKRLHRAQLLQVLSLIHI